MKRLPRLSLATALIWKRRRYFHTYYAFSYYP